MSQVSILKEPTETYAKYKDSVEDGILKESLKKAIAWVLCGSIQQDVCSRMWTNFSIKVTNVTVKKIKL